MKYPRLKLQQRRNQKITPKQIRLMKSQFDSGKSAWKISLETGISYSTVRRYIDPKFKQKFNDYYANYNKQKYHTDPKFKKYVNERRRENLKLQRCNYPKLDEYNRQKAIKQMERNHK